VTRWRAHEGKAYQGNTGVRAAHQMRPWPSKWVNLTAESSAALTRKIMVAL